MRRAFHAALLATALLASPAVAAERSAADPRAAANLRVFDKIWRQVDRNYYDQGFNGVDWDAARAEFRPQAQTAADETALYGVLKAMLGRLHDAHAFVESPTVLQRRAAAASGGAAAEAGEVRGRPPARRPAEARDGVWVVGFDEFDKGSAAWLADQIAHVPSEAPLVLDLRANRGGYISELRRSLACLVPERHVIARFTSRRGLARSERVPSCTDPRRGPLVVLVGPRTTSAAELFAAAVQESGRAAIVGERTGGAVLASQDMKLPDGGRLSVSVDDARTGSGVRLEGQGVRPDVEATTTAADRKAGLDQALAKAVEVARSQPATGFTFAAASRARSRA